MLSVFVRIKFHLIKEYEMKPFKFLVYMATILVISSLFLACENPTASDSSLSTDASATDSENPAADTNNPAGFTLSYHANGAPGITAPVDPSTYSHGETAVLLCMAPPAAWDEYDEDGTTYLGTHNFVGWNSQADGQGTTWHPDRSLIITSDITLYARWTQDAIYRLRIGAPGDATYGNDGNWYLAGDSVPLPSGDSVPVPEGHEFVGWEHSWTGDHLDAEEEISITTISNQNTYLARFQKQSYTLSVDLQGGTWPAEDLGTSFTLEYGSSLSDSISVDPLMTSASFQHWEMYFPEDETGYWDPIQLSTTSMPARNVELRAVFQPYVVF